MKPIFIVKLPQGDLSPMDIMEVVQGTKEYLLQDPISDNYHVLVIVDKNDRIEFECLNSPCNEIEINELQKYVFEKLESLSK
jgi:hypothetical protein